MYRRRHFLGVLQKLAFCGGHLSEEGAHTVVSAGRGRGRGSEGLEFPEPLFVPGHFGKLACLAFLSSEVALVW